jgi:hypothetical protein
MRRTWEYIMEEELWEETEMERLGCQMIRMKWKDCR